TRWPRDWSSDVCSSDLGVDVHPERVEHEFARALRAALEQSLPQLLQRIELVDRDRRRGDLDRNQQRGCIEQLGLKPLRVMLIGRSEERRVGKECRSRWW